jgi:hypothetical protein
MDKSVLTSRLDGLRNSLDIVIGSLAQEVWRPVTDADVRAELLGESMWNGLGDLIQQLIRQRDSLALLKKQIASPAVDDDALKNAWKSYTTTHRVSQSLLRECLDIIGTLAIRNKNLDRKILYVADELIRDCLRLIRGDESYYLMVHSLEDTISKTRARIIRLRFPEWTLWDLPLAAHELGHVIIGQTLDAERDFEEELRPLTSFRDRLRSWTLQHHPELHAKHEQGGDHAKEATAAAEMRVRVLIADAFATYLMGPAYVCAAIMLRLNPSAPSRQDRPSDVERAHVILNMLRWMNALARAQKPYTDIIGILDQGWESALSLAGNAVPLDNENKDWLLNLANEFGQSVGPDFLWKPTMYSADGWLRAQAWSNEWQKNKDKVPPSDSSSKLRDVLNATWLSRLEANVDDYAAIAAAGEDLCNEIIEARKRRALGSPTDASTRPGR